MDSLYLHNNCLKLKSGGKLKDLATALAQSYLNVYHLELNVILLLCENVD